MVNYSVNELLKVLTIDNEEDNEVMIIREVKGYNYYKWKRAQKQEENSESDDESESTGTYESENEEDNNNTNTKTETKEDQETGAINMECDDEVQENN